MDDGIQNYMRPKMAQSLTEKWKYHKFRGSTKPRVRFIVTKEWESQKRNVCNTKRSEPVEAQFWGYVTQNASNPLHKTEGSHHVGELQRCSHLERQKGRHSGCFRRLLCVKKVYTPASKGSFYFKFQGIFKEKKTKREYLNMSPILKLIKISI